MNVTGAILLGIILAALFLGVLFAFALLGTLVGAFIGWILSLTPLGGFVENGFSAFGVHASGKIVQIGAMLGFISGFAKGIVEVKHENDIK